VAGAAPSPRHVWRCGGRGRPRHGRSVACATDSV